MKKIKDFIKKNYIIVTIIVAIVFIVLASLLIIGLINKYSKKVEVTTENNKMYQISGNLKYAFDADITLHDGAYYFIDAKDYNLSSWNPIYLDDYSWVINSNDAVMVSYLQNFLMYKLPKYSKMAKESNSYKVNVNGKNYITNNYFVYDTKGHYYIFFDNVKLKYNGKIVELSPMSSVSASIVGLTYYNLETGEMFNFNENVNSAEIIFDTFTINLLNNIIKYKNSSIMINTNVDTLKTFKED